MDYFAKVKEIVKEVLELDDDSKITMDASFDNDLKADSIAKFELISKLEEDFDGLDDISDDDAAKLTTVGAVVKFLEEQLG